MALLKILQQGQEVPVPLQTCSSCGQKNQQDHMINLIIAVGSPGHPSLLPFQNEEIWACCAVCWSTIAHTLVNEVATHLHQQLLAVPNT